MFIYFFKTLLISIRLKSNNLISEVDLMQKIVLSLVIFISTLYQNCFPQTTSVELINKIDSSLVQLVKIQELVKDIHSCLTKFHPVAVPYKDSLLIFDYDTAENEYGFVKETQQPFPLPEGIQASFPLSVYGNKPTCIVNPNTFGNPAGYSTVLHEFIHCCQYGSVDPGLKESLGVYRAAMKNKDYSWEITYPFPYDDSLFIDYYDHFKAALKNNDIQSAELYRDKLKAHLTNTDFEYMLWEEWKEGLARYVENKILHRLNTDPNNYGKDKPYNRVSFYYSGELLIGLLTKKNPGLTSDMKLLFERMRDF